MDLSRRHFLFSTTAAAAGTAISGPATAQPGPVRVAQAGRPAPRGFDPADLSLKYELVIAGGEVLDPSQKLRGQRDIGIKYGQIAAIAPTIPADRTVQRIDATGKLVTPGLIDLHTHLCPHLGIGLPADELVPITCTTTAVSAGDAGWQTWGAFRHLALPHSRTEPRHRARGQGADHRFHRRTERPGAPAPRPQSGGDGGQRRSRDVSHRVGPREPFGAPRPPAPGRHSHPLLHRRWEQHGAERPAPPAAVAAKQRGVIIDVGHGGGSFDFTICEPAMQQGLTPDTISSDIHSVSINTPGYPTLPWVMTKFLALGMSLEDVVAGATVEPAKIIGRIPGLGTLQVGAPADIAILELVGGPVEFVDTRNNKRAGSQKLVPVLTIRGGRPFGRPPLPTPFVI